MTTILITFSYQKNASLFTVILNFINFYELDLLKSILKLENLIIHYIFILSIQGFICQNNILRFDLIHLPKFDYCIPDLIRSDFVIYLFL
jgi:hypothetical protein